MFREFWNFLGRHRDPCVRPLHLGSFGVDDPEFRLPLIQLPLPERLGGALVDEVGGGAIPFGQDGATLLIE